MASRKCDQCGASVAADEQFCPNCGSFLDPLEPDAPRGRENVISVSSDGNYEEFELGAPPPAVERSNPGRGEVTCPSCGANNPANNRHCQECGARLSQGPLPTAPRPAVQATAGCAPPSPSVPCSSVSWSLRCSSTSSAVTRRPPPAVRPSRSNTSTTIAELAPIDILDVECNQEGVPSSATT